MPTPSRPEDSKAALERARAGVLRAWRPVERASAEAGSKPRARGLDQLAPHVLQGLALDKKRSETEILRVWGDLQDPDVAAHARPTGLRNGTLFVSVDSDVWRDEIVRYRRREILERLRNSFGPKLVQRISFRVG